MSNIAKDLLFDTKARTKLLEGIEIVAKAVGESLGPKGKNTAIYEAWGSPIITHDGVTISNAIVLPDLFQDMGAKLIKEAAQKTSDKAGDGTSVTTILTHAIVKEALQNIQAGANPMTLKKEIEDSLQIALQELDKLKKEIKTDEEIESIATISSADPEKGKLVAEAFKKVGNEGIITVEDGKKIETTVEYKQGMEIDRGYLSPYFVTNQETVEAIIEDPYILLTDKKINYAREILPFIERFVQVSKNLVIFCGECVEEGMAFLVVNHLKGNIKVVAVQAPAYGDRRAEELQDIGILTGGTPILEDSGRQLESVQVEELGRAEKVIVNRDKTIIVNGAGDASGRMEELRKQLKLANTDYDKQIKEQRLAKLAGSVAVINIGAASDVEMKEKRKRFINAINSTKSAVSDGVVAGGEITLLKLAKGKTVQIGDAKLTYSTPGSKIFLEALKAPFIQLVTNAGLDYAEVREKMAGKDYPFGVDVNDGQVKDLIVAGVIDPVRVVRSALENSVSVATMIMTCNSLITDIPKEDK